MSEKIQKRSFDVAFLMSPDSPSSSSSTTSDNETEKKRKTFDEERSSSSGSSGASTFSSGSRLLDPSNIPRSDYSGYPNRLTSSVLDENIRHFPPGPTSFPSSLKKVLEPDPSTTRQTPSPMFLPPLFSPSSPSSTSTAAILAAVASAAAAAKATTPKASMTTKEQQDNLLKSLILSPTLTAALGIGSISASNTCALCGITFRMTSDLVYHMRTNHHKQTVPNYDSYDKKRSSCRLKCTVCGENFRERHHLTRHMTSHEDRKTSVEEDEDDKE